MNLQHISVIMAVYNESDYMIRQSIDSILNQSHQEFEFIIVNDNPYNQNIKDILINYKKKDKRVVYIFNERNIGLAESLNIALKIAKYDFIARMDADDIAFENRLEKQLNYISNHSNVDLIGTNVVFIDDNNNTMKNNNKIISDFKEINIKLPHYNTCYHPTWFFKRIIADDINGYRNFPCAQDYDFLLRALNKGYILENMNEDLLFYRIRENSISNSKKFQQYRMAILIRKMYKEKKTMQSDLNEETIKKLCNKDFKKFKYANELYAKAIVDMKQKKYYLFVKGYLKAILLSSEQRKLACNDLMCKLRS